jgi:dCMP deaminase
MHLVENHKALEADDHARFVTMANDIARRSNCIRRGVGALIVREGHVIAEGWNGVSATFADCRQAGCSRCINGGNTGSGYESCICIHAEQRAVADAARQGRATDGSILYVNLRPCLQCLAVAKAAGVHEVHFGGDDWSYSEEMERMYRTLAAQFDSFGRVDR